MSAKGKNPNSVGGKLPKNNVVSVDSVRGKDTTFEGWATKQGGSHKSWKKRYFILTTAKEGQVAELYYFKTEKAKTAIGVVRMSDRSSVKEASIKGRACVEIESGMMGARKYVMYCGSKEDQDKLMKALKDKIDSLKNEKKAPPLEDHNKNPVEPEKGIKASLKAAKNAIPFLSAEGNEERILEFWQIWTESIPTSSPEVFVTLVMTSDMNQLSWRVYGPQNVLIQEMVDFFWNVGAPEQEIDRLNDVGGLINPLTIGSWIDMSTKGGMDGGWVFPVNVSTVDALKACDEGQPLSKLSDWTKNNHIDECVTVGRDMGASPPRQTEIRFSVKGDSFDARLNIASSAYKEFGFPSLPDAFLALLRQWNPTAMELSVITSSEGFVRLGMILPDPEKNIVTQLCNLTNTNSGSLNNFHSKMKMDKPAFAEIQYLMESFGYGVYNEGWNVVFHYHLDPNYDSK